jgi:hypothetical protein
MLVCGTGGVGANLPLRRSGLLAHDVFFGAGNGMRTQRPAGIQNETVHFTLKNAKPARDETTLLPPASCFWRTTCQQGS